jgi:predicted metalloprotease
MSRRSENVEDQRGISIGKGVGGLGLGGIIILLLLGWLFKGDPLALLNVAGGSGGGTETMVEQSAPSSADDKMADFVSAVLGETEDVWTDLFSRSGSTYRKPKLVIFSGATQSACGYAQSATGPFYCPTDEKVYLDMSFFSELSSRFGASGDFAQAYVIAHEIGHHVQKLQGITDRIEEMRNRVSEEEYNQLSVRLELQADFYAGVWAYYAEKTKDILESGDIEEGLNAASAIGDDRIQKQTQGYVVPDAFTHGTSEQRVRWFRKGFETGDLRQGDTFSSNSL